MLKMSQFVKVDIYFLRLSQEIFLGVITPFKNVSLINEIA